MSRTLISFNITNMYVTGLLYHRITCITFQYKSLWGRSWNLFPMAHFWEYKYVCAVHNVAYPELLSWVVRNVNKAHNISMNNLPLWLLPLDIFLMSQLRTAFTTKNLWQGNVTIAICHWCGGWMSCERHTICGFYLESSCNTLHFV